MAASATSGSQTETKDAHKFWGYLIKPDKTAADKLDRLLRGIADCITKTYDPNDTHDVHPSQLASFYRAVGGDYDAVFLDMPPSAIAFIWQTLGCLHSLQPDPSQDAFSPPSIPALKPKGFVIWQTIQLLLGPEEHVAFLQNALHTFDVLDPVDGKPLPKVLPKTCFPEKPDPDMAKWYEDMTERLRRECEVTPDSDCSNASNRYDTDPSTNGPVDGCIPAAQYFSNPLYRNRDGRPAVVRRHHTSSPRSPVATLQARGKVVAKAVRHIWNPHLWDGPGRRDSHRHGHNDGSNSSGDITTMDRLRPPPRRSPSGEYSSTSSDSEGHSPARPRRSPGGLRHHKSYSPPRGEFPPYSYDSGGRRKSAAHVHHGPSDRHLKPPQSRSPEPPSRSPSRRAPPPHHHAQHSNPHESSSSIASSLPHDTDNRLPSAFGPSESPLFATRISQMQQPRPEFPHSKHHTQQQHIDSRPQPSIPHRNSYSNGHTGEGTGHPHHSRPHSNSAGSRGYKTPVSGSVHFATPAGSGYATPSRRSSTEARRYDESRRGVFADRPYIARHVTPLDAMGDRRHPVDVGFRQPADGMGRR